ncbi:MAG: glycosyltransferase family 39 protein [Coleofasciculus sp. G3-WIS-01]|uniref:ArnT family glycosyltransferase n=1 Tax=Coleofasciculus sp. G3-WIS-01 TaxID=3069528 RepID=UPI0032F234BE
MNRQTFIWGHSGSRIRSTQRWVERMWVFSLLLAALLLFCINLDSPPLLNGGEQTVNQVARELSSTPWASWQWFYPTFGDQSYVEEPPLLYWLIALAYKTGNDSTLMTRLPTALLSVLSIPLFYGIGREIFPSRQNALFSSFIYLTVLPVVQYGRLAILDSTVLCFVMLMMVCLLRSRRDFRWSLGAGIGFGLICLTQGIGLGFVLLAIGFIFIAWDTPRLLRSGYWWLGWVLGIIPALVWYTLPLVYSQGFLTANLVKESLQPFWHSVEINRILKSDYDYLLELLKFSVPWLLFWSYGLGLAWNNRNWGWAKFVLVWTGVYGGAVCLMAFPLPEYSLPLYPALALAGGAQLTAVWNLPRSQSYPRLWLFGLSFMCLGAIASTIYLVLEASQSLFPVVSSSVALTLAGAAILVARRDLQFIFILFWGMYVSLLLLMTSSHWIVS